MRALGFPAPEREHYFHGTRKWRFDFAWPALKVAVEVEGITVFGNNRDGSMKLGRHQTAKGYAEDCDKYNQAALLGWTVLRFTQKHVKSGEAINLVEELLTSRFLA